MQDLLGMEDWKKQNTHKQTKKQPPQKNQPNNNNMTHQNKKRKGIQDFKITI